MTTENNKIRLVFFGGLEEIGKNMMAVEAGNDIILIDCGMMFPEEEMLGVDIVVPDISYLKGKEDKIRGLILTHAHEDHIGALSYIYPQIRCPIYGTALTLALAEDKLNEKRQTQEPETHEIAPGQKIQLGCFELEFLQVCHSVSDGVAMAIKTPAGLIVHSGDFKIDNTPVDGKVTALGRFAQLGAEGVLVLMSDSTNADQPGVTLSEKVVGETFDRLFSHLEGRIIITTFASSIHRIQQAITTAINHGRKVAIVGRSMQIVVKKAKELGYLTFPDESAVRAEEIGSYPADKIAIITTGSQGEPMSALAKMAYGEHKQVDVGPGDNVIISAVPVPGNEIYVQRTINRLFKRGAKVIYESKDEVHVSGHAAQEELKLLLNLVRPKFFVPIHGEYRHLAHHAVLGEEVGIPKDHIFVAENGDILEFTPDQGAIVGKASAETIIIDGLGVTDTENIVLHERKILSRDGIVTVGLYLDTARKELAAPPKINSRGFIFGDKAEPIYQKAAERIKETYLANKDLSLTEIKQQIVSALEKCLFNETKRRPMILLLVTDLDKK